MNPFREKRDFLSALAALRKRLTKSAAPAEPPVSCPVCGQRADRRTLNEGLLVCPACGHHHSMAAAERFAMLFDGGLYREFDRHLKRGNPLSFPGYDARLKSLRHTTGLWEAAMAAEGKIGGVRAVACVLDSRFLMGSMGAAVGEKVTRAVERATRLRQPVIIFCTSGGARMQEGILSLFQMAKTAAAIERHGEAGLFYLSVLTHPTTGGVTASFASLGDVILAEPGALIGFAGPRVIEQTIGQVLPDGFQRAEYLLEHGFVDAIVPRGALRDTVVRLLKLHGRASK